LLALNAIAFGLFVISRLEPPQVKTLGPAAQYVYDLLHPPVVPEISRWGRRVEADVKALGGNAHVMELSRPFLGLFGGTELFFIEFHGAKLDDEALARLVDQYGDRILGLGLRGTRITDDGLRHLNKLTNLRQLTLANPDLPKQIPDSRWAMSPITDAGLIHLKGLTTLTNLNLDGLPITDAGLDALTDLPGLEGLSLSRTKTKGPGLGRLKSLPTLAVLYLEENELTPEGLTSLMAATSLQVLSLNRVQLNADALKVLRALPRLAHLEITGCGLLDEEVRDLRISKPDLEIKRD